MLHLLLNWIPHQLGCLVIWAGYVAILEKLPHVDKYSLVR
ncbi:hypothetical protein CLV88_1094 [Shimia abyssi]|uniref:Uncharacterized protein n=1 Tax=Shimia abyssi TaxID=1662395 RepID=A0A2P8FA83_9RHOB|nr:hypothetical protein CLV88_1094 [Shimia abyssi]